MSVIAVGTDVVDIVRIERLISRGGSRFLQRWFLPAELGSGDLLAARAATVFAVKEAALKAIGPDPDTLTPWRQIEVLADTSPSLHLHGDLATIAGSAGIRGFHVSASHDSRYAMATVVAVSEPVRPRSAVG